MDTSNDNSGSNGDSPRTKARSSETSYKFQRLREKLRSAIASGELSGKLPGERALAKRFHVNAKTLSKALTDLAAEGVLDRSIGRGTYVKGSAPSSSGAGRWLLLCDEGDADAVILLDYLRRANPDTQSTCGGSEARPSFLNAFSAVIDAASATPESFLRDLVVRNLSVVAVGREGRMYSMHAVLVDAALGAVGIGRDLMIAGHRRFAAVEAPGGNALTQALRQTAARLAPDATIDTFSPEDAARLQHSGATAIICDSASTARSVRTTIAQPAESQGTPGLASAEPTLPAGISLASVGISWGEVPCSGYYVDGAKVAEQVISLLRDPPAGRPATLWMAGELIDRGTTTPGTMPQSQIGTALSPGGLCSFDSEPVSIGYLFTAPHVGRCVEVTCSILVVDDHPVTREPLARLLRHEGFDATCAANGVEALGAVELSIPDLILLDVMMPKMNGVDFLQNVRADARFREIPVIAITGSMDPNHVERLNQLGVAEVITKARFTVEQLMESVRALTHSR